MGATKRDLSGVFDADLNAKRAKKTAVLSHTYHLSDKGITFLSDQGVPEWTEMRIELRLPQKGLHKDLPISCRGVVVECSPCQGSRGYRVTLLFLDLPKRTQAQLNIPFAVLNPSTVSVSR